MSWTQFWDMHSGGGQKLDWSHIYIEAPKAEAKVIFYNRFGRSPDRVSCTCCGEDYSISESPTLLEATAYQRGCAFDKTRDEYIEEPSTESYAKPYIPLDVYFNGEHHGTRLMGAKPLRITADEIKPEERIGSVPEEGYVWR